ncbi:MAG: hypothetical protein MZV64_42310 [Ignavibacteriales bacterium]|nr:hypothetical protein [Ignavibacteriales bacterium]
MRPPGTHSARPARACRPRSRARRCSQPGRARPGRLWPVPARRRPERPPPPTRGPARGPQSPPGSPAPRPAPGCARAAWSPVEARAGAPGLPLVVRARDGRHQLAKPPARHPRLVDALDVIDQGQRPLGRAGRARAVRRAGGDGRAGACSDCMRRRAPEDRRELPHGRFLC